VYNFTGADIPAEAKTYSIDQFEVRAPLAGPVSGQVFTETFRDLMQAQTPLDMVRSAGDLEYSGAIIGYDVQPVSIQADETAALNRLTMTVKVQYVNSFDEKKNKEITVTRFADYSSSDDLSSVESELVEIISGQLAQDIFDRTLGDW
jgi:hypothetical protein